MKFTSPIENGQVLCGEKGVWMNVEECLHCPAFQKLKTEGSAEFIVCKTAVERGLLSSDQARFGMRI